MQGGPEERSARTRNVRKRAPQRANAADRPDQTGRRRKDRRCLPNRHLRSEGGRMEPEGAFRPLRYA
jgi:hypothetical protein